MPKVVINTCFGGFGLSHKACMRYAEIKGFKLYPYAQDFKIDRPNVARQIKESEYIIHYSKAPVEFGKLGPEDDSTYWYDGELNRDDEALVQVVEELSKEANGNHADLSIANVPDDVEWEIKEYDGQEHIAEKHRTWYGE